MMFESAIEKRIKELDEHLVHCSNEKLVFQEKQKDGQMEIALLLSNPCVMFRDVDENSLNYFKCKKTADCIVFEQKVGDDWALHIFEMKRTVKAKEWAKIQEQFKGAYYNALAIAGFLGIEDRINDIRLYTCYSNDKLGLDPLATRAALLKADNTLLGWKNGKVELNGFKKLEFQMEKLQVDTNNQIQYSL